MQENVYKGSLLLDLTLEAYKRMHFCHQATGNIRQKDYMFVSSKTLNSSNKGTTCYYLYNLIMPIHGIWSHHFMGNRWGNSQILFWGAPKSLQMVTAAMKLKDAYSLEEKL